MRHHGALLLGPPLILLLLLAKNIIEDPLSVLMSALFFVNLSLSTGMVRDGLKYATIIPILKTPNSDTSILDNLRPISNLPFMSKILEKVVLVQLWAFLSTNHIYETFQSHFRKLHSTESASLKVS